MEIGTAMVIGAAFGSIEPSADWGWNEIWGSAGLNFAVAGEIRTERLASMYKSNDMICA